MLLLLCLLLLLLLLQVSYTPDLGAHQEYFLGAGGVFNLYTSLTGEELPGVTDAVAQVGLGGVSSDV
jgi:hypothetical protein